MARGKNFGVCDDLSLDALFEITGDLELPDSIHLAAVGISSRPREEQINRRPLPCPPHLDIPSLPLVALRGLAIHAYKLRRNWSSQSPSPVSTHSFEINNKPLNLLPVQGTRMVIAISLHRLGCWDTISGECIAAFEHGAQRPWIASVAPLSTPGICSVGMVSVRWSILLRWLDSARRRTFHRLGGLPEFYENESIKELLEELDCRPGWTA
ncbi:hypothetical protein DFH07DRAFT_780910 [Mycena maculata]|uniref:Uncharacterized protein n=1 Tax=Mycena maculata TaxID=230809 RepID=A0AAD7I2A9_9AGAR|nr:hypothetical protein DFH07DRAFT_780910 [Mycena maculata]